MHVRKLCGPAAVLALAVLAVPAASARAEEGGSASMRAELDDAVEYFVTNPVREFRNPTRAHATLSTLTVSLEETIAWTSSSDFGFKRKASTDPVWFRSTDLASVTGLTLAQKFDVGGQRFVGELDLGRVSDIRDKFAAEDYAAQFSLSHQLCPMVTGVFGLSYDDGPTLGHKNDAVWSPSLTLLAPLEIHDMCVVERTKPTRGGEHYDKLLPSVTIAEFIQRIGSGPPARHWGGQVALGYERELSPDISLDATVTWAYRHTTLPVAQVPITVNDDSFYTARLGVRDQFDQNLSIEMFVQMEKGFVFSGQHDTSVGLSFNVDF